MRRRLVSFVLKDFSVLKKFLMPLFVLYLVLNMIIIQIALECNFDIFILSLVAWIIFGLSVVLLLPQASVGIEEKKGIYISLRSLPVTASDFYISKNVFGIIALLVFYLLPGFVIEIPFLVFLKIPPEIIPIQYLLMYIIGIFIIFSLLCTIFINVALISKRSSQIMFYILIFTFSCFYFFEPLDEKLYSMPMDAFFRYVLSDKQSLVSFYLIVSIILALSVAVAVVGYRVFIKKFSYSRFN